MEDQKITITFKPQVGDQVPVMHHLDGKISVYDAFKGISNLLDVLTNGAMKYCKDNGKDFDTMTAAEAKTITMDDVLGALPEGKSTIRDGEIVE